MPDKTYVLNLIATRILSFSAHDLELLLGGLEATVAELGGSVDELELDLLQRLAAGVLQEGLAQGDAPLAGAHDAALDHQPVVLHATVVGEATERRDALDREVEVGGGVRGVGDLAISTTHASGNQSGLGRLGGAWGGTAIFEEGVEMAGQGLVQDAFLRLPPPVAEIFGTCFHSPSLIRGLGRPLMA